MKNTKIVYIGEFPEPYGGITIKNKLLYNEMSKLNNMKKVDLMECKHKLYLAPLKLINIIIAFIKKDKIIYGLESHRAKRIIKIQSFFKKSLKNTTVVMMGGIFQNEIVKDKKLIKLYSKLNSIWVETDGMKSILNSAGLKNVKVFPNPKRIEKKIEPVISKENSEIKLVYFSQISKEKGAIDVFKCAKMLNRSNIKYSLDFYGVIVDAFKEEFYELINKTANVEYRGVFDSTKSDVYKKLNTYDILLFPTHWKTEGVPGILVEAKIAGLAVIASKECFNREIVQEENHEGFILEENYDKEMYDIISGLYDNRELLNLVKKFSHKSKSRYDIEKYKEYFNLK